MSLGQTVFEADELTVGLGRRLGVPRILGGGTALRKLALVTDAWLPQTNGVVITLSRLVKHLEAMGMEVAVFSPNAHRTVPLPSYPEIRIACDPWKAIARIKEFAPDAVHVATEGPLGFAAVAWLRMRGLRFTTSFHTRYPEYVSARVPVPVEWGYELVRWFHRRAQHTLVSSRSLLNELEQKQVGRKLVHWPRGVDSDVFHPHRRRGDVYALPGPIWLYVGRVAVEKSLEDFLKLPLPGTKVVVGDGPAREELERRFPDVVRLPVRRRPGGALRQRRLLRLPVAHRDLRQRDPGGAGLGVAGGVGAGAGADRSHRRGRQRRHRRRPARRLPAGHHRLAREGPDQHRGSHLAGRTRGLPPAPGSHAAGSSLCSVGCGRDALRALTAAAAAVAPC
jgi:glycosyltransferase involved in cell wall biosynthesis